MKLFAQRFLNKYNTAKEQEQLNEKTSLSIVTEQAPRVLSNIVLRSVGSNIYSNIVTEGRKFKVGLTAITQLTSVIPKTILANMNTKIILGNELSTERSAIIQRSSQVLSSSNDKNIARLDEGEAIITSNFARFAVPIKIIPLFEELVTNFVKTFIKKTKTKVRVIT